MPGSWDEQRFYYSQPRKKGTLSYILMYIFVSRLFYFVDPILSIFKVWDPQTPPPLTLWFTNLTIQEKIKVGQGVQ